MAYEKVADRIIIQTSRIGAVIWLTILCGITIGWQWIVFGMPQNLNELMAHDKGLVGNIGLGPVFFLVAGLPVFLIPGIVKNLQIAVAGRTIIIDGAAKTISKNGKELLRFQEIRNFNFKTMEDSTIVLDIILLNGKKVKLGKLGPSGKRDTYKTDIREVVQYSQKTLDELPRKDSTGKVFAIIHYIILVISILLFIGAVYAVASSVVFGLLGTTTSGKVIDIKKETVERIKESGRVGRPRKKVRTESEIYTFTVEYQDSNGTMHQFETSALNTHQGSSVTVVYLSFWPQYARVKSFSGMWGAFVILLVFGVILFCVSQMFNEKFFEKMKMRKERKENTKKNN